MSLCHLHDDNVFIILTQFQRRRSQTRRETVQQQQQQEEQGAGQGEWQGKGETVLWPGLGAHFIVALAQIFQSCRQ